MAHKCPCAEMPFVVALTGFRPPPPLGMLLREYVSLSLQLSREAVVEALPIELWKFLVLPRLRPSEVCAVGRCGGVSWLALLAAQRLRSIIVLCALFSMIILFLEHSNLK